MSSLGGYLNDLAEDRRRRFSFVSPSYVPGRNIATPATAISAVVIHPKTMIGLLAVNAPMRSCQTKAKASLSDPVWPLRSGLSRNELPLGQCGGAAMLVGLAIDEVAFSVEVVVDGGVN